MGIYQRLPSITFKSWYCFSVNNHWKTRVSDYVFDKQRHTGESTILLFLTYKNNTWTKRNIINGKLYFLTKKPIYFWKNSFKLNKRKTHWFTVLNEFLAIITEMLGKLNLQKDPLFINQITHCPRLASREVFRRLSTECKNPLLKFLYQDDNVETQVCLKLVVLFFFFYSTKNVGPHSIYSQWTLK